MNDPSPSPEEEHEDNVSREEWLSSLLPLTDAGLEGDDEDLPELSEERMEALVGQVRSRFSSKEDDSSAEAFINQTLPLSMALDETSDASASKLSEDKMNVLLGEVRNQFGSGKESETSEKEEKKMISFKSYFAPMAMAAAVAVAFVIYSGDGDPGESPIAKDGEPDAFPVELASVSFELGDWKDGDEDAIRGGDDPDSEKAKLPDWVEPIEYDEKSAREVWLGQDNPKKPTVKVWVDRTFGVIKIYRPGATKPEEVPLEEDRKESEQLLEVLQKLKKEFDPKP